LPRTPPRQRPQRRRHLPNDAAVARLVTAVVVEAHDEWAVAERRYLSEESMAKLYAQPAENIVTQELPLAVTA
jgi:transposase-like protein